MVVMEAELETIMHPGNEAERYQRKQKKDIIIKIMIIKSRCDETDGRTNKT